LPTPWQKAGPLACIYDLQKKTKNNSEQTLCILHRNEPQLTGNFTTQINLSLFGLHDSFHYLPKLQRKSLNSLMTLLYNLTQEGIQGLPFGALLFDLSLASDSY
jgi:hypothetical protein